jgi:hypothetical protein
VVRFQSLRPLASLPLLLVLLVFGRCDDVR